MKVLMRFALLALFLVVISFGGMLLDDWTLITSAQEDKPQRQTEILVSYTQYQWWLSRWSSNEVVCYIPVEHDGTPTHLEVLYHCGDDLFDEWRLAPPCEAAAKGKDVTSCEGLYLFLAGSQPAEKTVAVDLPMPTIWISLTGCIPNPPDSTCDRIPKMAFTALEPLPNEEITGIHIEMDGRVIQCNNARCEIPLIPTNLDGEVITFWADSTYGDESEHFTARIRVVDGGVSPDDNQEIWYIDVVSTQWRGESFSSCAASWGSFPPLGGLPVWLTTPPDYMALASDTPYVYLAAQLIEKDLVDTSMCPDGGLLGNGAASTCGLQAARPLVNEWQDTFDQTIYNVAGQRNIPAFLLKNLFAHESQFWPGQFTEEEYGLGQLTEIGADTALLWNPTFFDEFCPLIFHQETCAQGYTKMSAENQELLRGAVAAQSAVTCPNCALSIDLAHAQSTVDLFAQTLLANCEQVAFLVYDITGETPGVVSTYEDLWQFTLANYNGGPGCVAKSMNRAWSREKELTWGTLTKHVEKGCEGFITYVDRVTNARTFGTADFVPTITPSPVPVFTRAPTQTPTITPLVSVTPTPTAIPPTSTAAAQGSPTPTGSAGYPPAPTSTEVGYPGPPTPLTPYP